MKNDVFLSFRGEQTRKTFLSHLLSSLKKKDITTSTSSESCPVSVQALQVSLVAIPIFSNDHASLDLWVDDLATIIDCDKKGTLTAVPVFFQLDPNDFLKMLRSFEDLRALTLRAKSTIIGVCGVEGVGKTSLVRHVYDDISPHFQHYFFFINRIRTQDCSYKPESLVTDLAREALKESSFHGRSIDAIKEMIRRRKVLLVADGVDDIKQLKGIIKEASWFGPGSRVIVITKDRSLLTQCGVKHIYELDCPKFEEALALFSEFAFKERKPRPGFEELSFLAVQVSNRLPLTLKMLGTFLCNKEKSEWFDKVEGALASKLAVIVG